MLFSCKATDASAVVSVCKTKEPQDAFTAGTLCLSNALSGNVVIMFRVISRCLFLHSTKSFFFTKELRIEAFQAMQTSEIIGIFMYFPRPRVQHMTCMLCSIRLISISVYLLRPSSQQGQGTFILIYSKGRLSFNFLHIHKRVSHPRSNFPFQP